MSTDCPSAVAPNLTVIQPEGFAPPRGYSNGIVATGRTLYVAGQIGWDAACRIVPGGLTAQFAQALDNVLAVVRAAGGDAGHIVRLTVYVTDLPAYRAGLREIGAAWRARMGRHYPVMALVGVAGLVEVDAVVEIEATAALPEAEAEPAVSPALPSPATAEEPAR